MITKYETTVYNDAGQCVETFDLTNKLKDAIKEAEDYASLLTEEEIENEGLDHICVYRIEMDGDEMIGCETEYEIGL